MSARPAVSVGGQCLRDLRDLHDLSDPMFARYAVFSVTLNAMDALYSQCSTSVLRPSICQSRSQPRQAGAPGHRKTPAISIQCPYNSGLFRTFLGYFRGVWGRFQGLQSLVSRLAARIPGPSRADFFSAACAKPAFRCAKEPSENRGCETIDIIANRVLNSGQALYRQFT